MQSSQCQRSQHATSCGSSTYSRTLVISCKKLGRLYAAYHGSVARAARMWSIDQRGALQLREHCGANIVRIHRYEDLVLRPRETLQGICEFLEIEWQESMLEYHLAQAAQRERSTQYLHRMWANLDRPVTTTSVGQWEKKLTPSELRVVETEVGSLLPAFGYFPEAAEARGIGTLGFTVTYRLWSTTRYVVGTLVIWLAWLLVTRDFQVPLDVVLGKAVRAHLPYERFRDRFGYRL
jgi:hypothetical protein